MSIKLIAFDLDGVLVDGRGSWGEIHNGLGTLEESECNGREYFSGKITFDEWAKLDVKLWLGVNIGKIQTILQKTRMMKGIYETIPKLRKNYKLVIISGGINILADRIKEEFNMDYAIANELSVKDEKVTGINNIVDFMGKGNILREIAGNMNISPDECAVVGDYINDIPMFDVAGLSIAFDPKHEDVIDSADNVVYEKDLRGILKFFNGFEK